MFKCLLIPWAPLLTLVCAGFSCLGIYHDGGTISGSDASVDEGIGKWLSRLSMRLLSLGRDR